jgi:hypothetical protein
MSYTPKPGSYIAKAIELLKVTGPLSTSTLAAELKIASSDVRANMKTAVTHGLLFSERNGPLTFWNLGAGTQQVKPAKKAAPKQPEVEPCHEEGITEEDDEFLVSLHSDGDLTIQGGQPLETGFLLTKKQALKLAYFLEDTAGLLERLERDQLRAAAPVEAS